jgi:hypothetical protein
LKHGANREGLKEVKQLRKKNEMLKQIIAEKELESILMNELLEKVSVLERKAIARQYIAYGLNRDQVLRVCEVSNYQNYHDPSGKKGGLKPSTTTPKINNENQLVDVSNTEVVDEMVKSELSGDGIWLSGYECCLMFVRIYY